MENKQQCVELSPKATKQARMTKMIRTFQHENVQVDVVPVYNAFRCSKNRVKHLFSKILENIYSSRNVDLIVWFVLALFL